MHSNNINLLRLLAACQVVISHAIGHFSIAPNDSLVVIFIRMFPGVPIFFLLSGFLIYNAWERDRNIWSYWINRVVRIFPALWFSFGVTIAILYFAGQLDGGGRETGAWVAAQLTLLQFYNPEFLRDFGVGVVNGALWSISTEIQFYFVLPIMAIFFRNLNGAVIATLSAFVINFVFFRLENDGVLSKVLGVSVFPYLSMFFIGILFARFNGLLKFSRSVNPFVFLVMYMALYYLSSYFFGYNQSGRTLSFFASPMLAFLIFSFSFRDKIDIGWLDRNDVSYGVYLYHMVYINVAIFFELSIFSSVVFVVMATLASAIVSWLLVEKPMLYFKRNSAMLAGYSGRKKTAAELR